MPPQAPLDEMRALLTALPGPDLDSGTAALEQIRHLPGAPGGFGRLGELVRWLATWQGRHPARLGHARFALFAANHGIAAETDESTDDIQAAVDATVEGATVLSRLCAAADADLRLYEMALEQPTDDFTTGPAMSEADCARAMAYGMMAVESGIDLMILGSIGAGGDTAAVALGQGLLGTAIESAHASVIARGLARHQGELGEPFEAMRRLGGVEIAAIAGAILAARRGRIPVLLDGLPATAAALMLHRADRRSIDHCRIAQLSPLPGHHALVAALDQTALLDLGIGAGDGSGGALALGLLRGALTGLAG